MEPNIESVETDTNVVIQNNDDDSYVLSYYIEHIENEKVLEKIVKKVESMVRTSSQYRQYVQYVKTNFDLNNCATMPNVIEDQEENSSVKIEMHHFPFTLYDICETVIYNNVRNNILFSTLTVANEVLGLHMNNLVGIVPLSKTVHQAVHSGLIKLNIQMVQGDVPTFIELFRGSFSKSAVAHYNAAMEQELDIDILNRF